MFFKVKYGICYISAKNGLIAMKQIANILIEIWASNVTIEFDLGHDLGLEFSRSNMEFAISQPKIVRLPRNLKTNISIGLRPQLWPSGLTVTMTLTLISQGQICNLLYLSPKWSDCHETKSKPIDSTLDLKCDHQVWPWQWPWSLNFQGQMWPRPLTISVVLTKDFHGQILK